MVNCLSIKAYLGALCIARILIMHIAIDKGSKEGESFEEYIKFLIEKGFLTKENKKWVDKIRTSGNNINHKAKIPTLEEIENIKMFTEYLLITIYEFDKFTGSNK